jgi:hypothetical protein
MYTDEEKTYLQLRDQFKLELERIVAEIVELKERRDALESLLNGEVKFEDVAEAETVPPAQPEETLSNRERVIAYLREFPGSSRRTVEEALSLELKHTMSKLSKDGLIKNKGPSKSHAQWHVTRAANSSGRV